MVAVPGGGHLEAAVELKVALRLPPMRVGFDLRQRGPDFAGNCGLLARTRKGSVTEVRECYGSPIDERLNQSNAPRDLLGRVAFLVFHAARLTFEVMALRLFNTLTRTIEASSGRANSMSRTTN